MLQWMGGSRRKVTTLAFYLETIYLQALYEETKIQKQYFEQRKRRQQLSSGSENWHDAADTGREQKEHRSLDIISLLNLSTIPQKDKDAIEANTSTVRSHFMKDPVPTLYNIETLEKSGDFENKQQIDETGAPFGYPEDTLSPMKNVSNDPNNGNTAKNKVDSQSEQGKISVEQSLSVFDLLGDDGMAVKYEGSPLKEAHVAFSVDGLGRVGTETPACSPQHASRSFSYGFSSHLERVRPWNPSKNTKVLDDFELEGDIKMHCDDGSLNYSFDMMDTCDNPKKKTPTKTHFRSVEDCKRNEHSSRTIFDGTDGERDGYGDPVESSLKHHTYGYDYDLMADVKRNPKATRISDLQDKTHQRDWFCSMEDDVTDNFSLLSEESCSTSAVRGEPFDSTPLNSNPKQSMRRAMDDDAGPGNSYSVNSIYSRDPHYKIKDEEPKKYVRESNSSKSNPVHHTNSPFMEKPQTFKTWSFEKEFNFSSPCQRPVADCPFRGSMPWNEYPCTESSLPESSFTNKHVETVPRPSSTPISKRPSFHPSNIATAVLECNPCSNSKFVRTYTSMTETTSSHGEDQISPVLSAQGSVGTCEKSGSKAPSLGSEKVDFHEDKCNRIRSKVCVEDTNEDWLDDSNLERKNCDSIRNETENESPAVENLEASHDSDLVINGGKTNKFNPDDKVSVPYSKEEKEVEDVKVEGRKRRSKSCNMVDSSSQVMMLESYVLQLLFVQKKKPKHMAETMRS
ncbi:hypothetical protein Csa_020937 [Cucumis sativus]|nr:hypothetical protein Csa_020937 [Cucumis sativus]